VTFATAGTSSNAHTYRLLIVKELCSVLPCRICESSCSSASEKRDYAVFHLTRQLILFCSAHQLPGFFRALQKQEANYSKPQGNHASAGVAFSTQASSIQPGILIASLPLCIRRGALKPRRHRYVLFRSGTGATLVNSRFPA
jgi:hypothetical protein